MNEIPYILSVRARNQLWDRLDSYFQLLEQSQLADSSKIDYYYFAECFVRWIDGQFTPGKNIK